MKRDATPGNQIALKFGQCPHQMKDEFASWCGRTAVMTFNGGFATASRFLYAAARENTLLPIFSRISIAFAVPYVTVITLTALSAAIAVIIFFTGQFTILILVGAV